MVNHISCHAHFTEKEVRSMRVLLLGNEFVHMGKIGIFPGTFILESKEIREITKYCEKIWKEIEASRGFLGFIRFDLVPIISQLKRELRNSKNEIDLGELKIQGLYEVNVHSPECCAATCVLRHTLPSLTKYQPSPVQRLAEKVKQTFPKSPILFIAGNGKAKKEWGEIFFLDLIKEGIPLIRREPEDILRRAEEIMKSSQHVIWRWGDARLNFGPSEFSLEFQDFLLQYQKLYPRSVFNTLPRDEKDDPGNKEYLLNISQYNNKKLTKETIEWAVENKSSLVAKPLFGSSGNGIYFGRMMDTKEWKTTLLELLRGPPYGLFTAMWLPKVNIKNFGSIALDINPAFWVEGEKLHYLYTVVRVDSWENYLLRGIINVSQGGGFAGIVKEEN